MPTSHPPRRSIVLCLIPMLLAGSAAQGQQQSPPTPLDRAIAATADRLHADVTVGLDIWVDRSRFENAWVGRSPHFRVHTTAGLAEARDLAAGMETMLGHFQTVLGTDFAPAEPMVVFVLPDRAAYNGFGDQFGTEHSSFYGSFYADGHPERPVAVEWSDNPTQLRMQMTHSVVHQYLAAAWPGTTNQRPLWIEEGLAAYFASYWNPDWTLDAYLRAKEAGRVGSIATLLRTTPPTFQRSADYFFLQLAVFFDYLLRIRPDTMSTPGPEGIMRGPFRDYLVSVLDGSGKGGDSFVAMLDEREQLAEDFANHPFK